MVDVVVFYVYFINIEINLGLYYVIVYDYVVMNFGNGYNKYFGVFIVLKVGMYVFFWIIFVNLNFYFLIEFVVNSYWVGIVFVYVSIIFNGVIGLVVIQFQQDDVVMVRLEFGYNFSGNIYSDNKMKMIFFGWCILFCCYCKCFYWGYIWVLILL